MGAEARLPGAGGQRGFRRGGAAEGGWRDRSGKAGAGFLSGWRGAAEDGFGEGIAVDEAADAGGGFRRGEEGAGRAGAEGLGDAAEGRGEAAVACGAPEGGGEVAEFEVEATPAGEVGAEEEGKIAEHEAVLEGRSGGTDAAVVDDGEAVEEDAAAEGEDAQGEFEVVVVEAEILVEAAGLDEDFAADEEAAADEVEPGGREIDVAFGAPFAIAVAADDIGGDGAGAGKFLEAVDHAFDGAGAGAGVVVEGEGERGLDGGEAEIVAAHGGVVGMGEEGDGGEVAADPVRGAVGGGIVDDDDAEVREGEVAEAGEGGEEFVAAVVGADDGGDGGHGEEGGCGWVEGGEGQ